MKPRKKSQKRKPHPISMMSDAEILRILSRDALIRLSDYCRAQRKLFEDFMAADTEEERERARAALDLSLGRK